MTKVSAEAALQLDQLELGVGAQLLVERRHRLVEQQHARALDQRAPQRDTLALAAGQLVRLARAELFHPDQSQHVGDAPGDFAPVEPLLLQAERDIGFHGEMRKQRVALEHHVDRPPVRRHRREVHAVEQHAAGIRPFEARDQPQQGSLAAARRPQQRKEFAFINIERKVIDDGRRTEALDQTLDAQQRTLLRIGPGRKISFRSDARHSHDTSSGRPETSRGFF